MLGVVFSGGGAAGCFQVGAIKAMEEMGIRPDMVAGVSTGNLQAAMVAQGKIDKLYQIWSRIKESDIYIRRYSIWQLGWKYLWSKLKLTRFNIEAIYDFKPLYNLIRKNVAEDDFKIPFRCGVTCFEDSLYYTIHAGDKDRSAHEHLHEFVFASASMPIYAPSVKIAGRHYYDGGLRNQTPLREAVEYGCDEIIMLLCSPLTLDRRTFRPHIEDIAERTLEIILNEGANEDLGYMKFINELVDQDCLEPRYRNIKFTVIAPKEQVVDTLDFDRKKLERGLQIGYDRAMDIIKNSDYGTPSA
ncbi:MAG: hypothetical protein GWN61_22445 [candidate division Zixibacteria bacterium]|nr:hypothetical protein [candidate division Zixibacteria bacterium]NIR67242.1 hypothetical protein [candidate division Zixibacteria bacterium]NIS16086.1 hypothetical protein [candidate division Zixibacteria bacterium]NIS48624.1 hypothetical protein [candidate division Zixibacteria bacterium]NIU16691.1 hypothetical protein [candidate division Zixibacteria bacterium]